VRASGEPLCCHVLAYGAAEGDAENRVRLSEVEYQVENLANQFRVAKICLDPYQGLLLAERLRRRGFEVQEYTFTSASRQRLFDVLLTLVRQRRLTSVPHPVFREELEGLNWVERGGSLRPDHESGGHDDSVVAVALAAWAAIESGGARAPLLFGSPEDMRAQAAAYAGQGVQLSPGELFGGRRSWVLAESGRLTRRLYP
jgi:hypothetical protein